MMRFPVSVALAVSMLGPACLDVPAPPAAGADGGQLGGAGDVDADAVGQDQDTDGGSEDTGAPADADPGEEAAAGCGGRGGYLFCDGFGDGLSRWDESTGKVEVNGGDLLVSSEAGEPAVLTRDLEPFVEGTRYLRGDFELDDALEVFDGVTIFGLFASDSTSNGFGIAVTGGELAILQPDGALAALGSVPSGDGFCLELEASVSGGSMELKLTVNGEDRTVTAPSPGAALDELRLGLLPPGPDGAATYEADDIVVATESDDCNGPP